MTMELADALDAADGVGELEAVPEESVIALALSAKSPEYISFAVYTVLYANSPRKVRHAVWVDHLLEKPFSMTIIGGKGLKQLRDNLMIISPR